MSVAHFQIIPRGQRARPILRTIRLASKKFKAQVAAGDIAGMRATSERAWNALTNLFEILRNEQDQGNLDKIFMDTPTGFIVDGISRQKQISMIAADRLDRSHTSCRPISLRDALNKIAHYNTTTSTFRIDGRGAHFLVLGGILHEKRWVAEILVSTLTKKAAIALRAIR